MFSHFTSFVFIQLAKRLFATVVFPGVCVCVVLRWFGHCFKISACTFGRSFNISINAMTIQIIFSVYAGSAAASWSRYRCWITILVNIFTWWYLRKPTEATQYQLIIVFMENANCPNIIRTMRKWKNDNVHVVCVHIEPSWMKMRLPILYSFMRKCECNMISHSVNISENRRRLWSNQ